MLSSSTLRSSLHDFLSVFVRYPTCLLVATRYVTLIILYDIAYYGFEPIYYPFVWLYSHVLSPSTVL